ncbi:MAG TPA: type I-E CRISPR-associated endonuclease Cas1e [Candidatus Kapabacteria bacterium]|nr:type I-E CRISPR-associated endonuclease Cas1e [Candidatus Kapabacteria bacterium]
MKEHEIPVMPIKSRVSIFAVERGNVERDGSALVVMDREGTRAQLPVGATTALMLEPGTTISHEAVKLCAESRTLILWTGEAGVRIYSAGQEGAAHTYRLLRQARLALDARTRMAVAREMYRMRFNEEVPARRSIQQVRGMEGARVRARYQELSREYGIPWRGRNYDRSDWDAGDVINRAVSAANSCLYGVCHAAILIAGYSAAIGFVHTGYSLAFVHDIADLWKMDLSVPVAFKVVAAGEENAVTRVRHQLRDEFRRSGFMENVIPTIERVLDAGTPGEAPPGELGGAHPELSTVEDAPWYHGIRTPDGSSGRLAGNCETEAPHAAEASHDGEEPDADWRAAESAGVLDPLGLNDPQAGRGTGW